MKRAFQASLLASLSFAVAASSYGQEFVPPEPTDPTNTAPAGSLPGAYPLGVSGANVNITPLAGSTLNGAGQDDLKVVFAGSGPLKWTESRHNEGDVAFLISPFAPSDPSYYPPNSHGVYTPNAGQPFANTTLAWRVNQFQGALLASVRHNGVTDNIVYGGSPVGKVHGIAYFNADFGQGWGYNMRDGVYGNGGNGASDMQMGVAGFDDNAGEASFNVATSFFPYSEGWQGAWVNSQTSGPGVFGGFAPGLDAATVVTWNADIATVKLPGVNSANDGMLFVAPTSSGNSSDIAAATPSNGGWNVAVREDQNDDLSGSTLNTSGNNGFQFLYVPYTANNLVGGHINGTTGAPVKSAGDASFDLTRTSAGQYRLSVFQADGVTKKLENDGMIILSVAGIVPTNSALPDRTFLSYQYDAQSGDFIIQSREVAAINSPNSENQFGDDLALRDSNFYFTWVDFTNPLSLASPPIPGDFDKDGNVDQDDLAEWKTAFGQTALGDADGDNDSDGSDFLIWQRNLGAGPPATAATAAVPEPASALLGLAGISAVAIARRRS